jgi:hypothetical protein
MDENEQDTTKSAQEANHALRHMAVVLCVSLGLLLLLDTGRDIHRLMYGTYCQSHRSTSQVGDNDSGLSVELQIVTMVGISVAKSSVCTVVACGLMALGLLLYRRRFSLKALLASVLLVGMLGSIPVLLPLRPAKLKAAFYPLSKNDDDVLEQVCKSLQFERVAILLDSKLADDAQRSRWRISRRVVHDGSMGGGLVIEISAPAELDIRVLQEAASAYLLYAGFYLQERIRHKLGAEEKADDAHPALSGGVWWPADSSEIQIRKCFEAAKRDAAM